MNANVDIRPKIAAFYRESGYSVVKIGTGELALWLPNPETNRYWPYDDSLLSPVANLRLSWSRYLIKHDFSGCVGDAVPLSVIGEHLKQQPCHIQ